MNDNKKNFAEDVMKQNYKQSDARKDKKNSVIKKKLKGKRGLETIKRATQSTEFEYKNK